MRRTDPARRVLLFVGPEDTPLAQGLHELRHERMELRMFLVPVGRRPDGELEYEAVFN